LAVWAIAGAFIAASSCFLSFLPIPRLHVSGEGFWDVLWMNSLRLGAVFGPFLLGLGISLWSERRFKRGFQNGIWSEAEVESVRTLVTKPGWAWMSTVFIAAIVLNVIFSARTSHAGGLYTYVLLFPVQIVTRIRQLVAPAPKSGGALIDWQSSKTIHSDHWGQPPVHPSE
jgi:hypothetical protein